MYQLCTIDTTLSAVYQLCTSDTTLSAPSLVAGLQGPQVAAQHRLQLLHELPLMLQDVLHHLTWRRIFQLTQKCGHPLSLFLKNFFFNQIKLMIAFHGPGGGETHHTVVVLGKLRHVKPLDSLGGNWFLWNEQNTEE